MPTNKVASDVFTVNDFEALQSKGFWHRYGGLVAVVALHGALLWFVFNGLTHQTPPPTKVVAQTLIQEVALSRAPVLEMPIPVSVTVKAAYGLPCSFSVFCKQMLIFPFSGV